MRHEKFLSQRERAEKEWMKGTKLGASQEALLLTLKEDLLKKGRDLEKEREIEKKKEERSTSWY